MGGDCTQDTQWSTLYSGTAGPTGTAAAQIFAPPLCPSRYATDLIRLDFDTAAVPGWNNFDAVAAFGTTGPATGLVHATTSATSPNRVVYQPWAGIHGTDYFEYKLTDCSDVSNEAARAIVTVEPPTGSFLDAFAYTVTADDTYNSGGGEATSVAVDLSAVCAKLGDITAVAKVWANEFDSVSLSSWSSALSLGDTVSVDVTISHASIHLDVVSNGQSRKVFAGSEIVPVTRLELWVHDSADTSSSPTTFRIIHAHCPFGFMALLSSGSAAERSSCKSCASIEANIEAGTLTLSETDSQNFNTICSSAARSAFQCVAGEYFNSSELACRPCRQGTFAKGSGARSGCALCSKSQYAPEESMATCLACPYGTFSDVKGADECHRCPDGATCNASSVNVNSGRWRSAAQPLELYECPITEACPGGTGYDASLCDDGFVGPLCSHCDSQHFLSWCVVLPPRLFLSVDYPALLLDHRSGKRCESCGKTTNHRPTLGVAVVLGLIVVGLLVSTRKRLKSTATYKFMSQMRSVGKVKFKSLFFALQVISEFARISTMADGEQFPEPANSVSGGLGLTNLDVLNFVPTTCIYREWDYYDTLVAKTVMPLAIICLFWTWPLSKAIQGKPYAGSRDIAVKLSLSLLEILLVSVSTTIMQCFMCRDVGGKFYLRAQLTLPCDSSRRRRMYVTLASLMVLVYPLGEREPPESPAFITLLVQRNSTCGPWRRCAVAHVRALIPAPAPCELTRVTDDDHRFHCNYGIICVFVLPDPTSDGGRDGTRRRAIGRHQRQQTELGHPKV